MATAVITVVCKAETERLRKKRSVKKGKHNGDVVPFENRRRR